MRVGIWSMAVATVTVTVMGLGVGLVSGATAPLLSIAGFSWAENLAFDGLGGLFVSEAVQGKLYRIALDVTGTNYSIETHLSRGFKQFGGLAPSVNGSEMFAAAIFADGSTGVVRTSTQRCHTGDQAYSVVASNISDLLNGLALVPEEGALFGTSEKGTLTRVDVATGEVRVVVDDLSQPDGLWFDTASQLLFVGELVTKRVKVFSPATGRVVQDFAGASSLSAVHLLDDLTVVGKVDPGDVGATVLAAADWTGRQVLRFTLRGDVVEVVAPPAGVQLFEPTSIRRGRGVGFDAESFYLTEGGGATVATTDRRVLQLPPGAV